jgi:hypothetical protein
MRLVIRKNYIDKRNRLPIFLGDIYKMIGTKNSKLVSIWFHLIITILYYIFLSGITPSNPNISPLNAGYNNILVLFSLMF